MIYEKSNVYARFDSQLDSRLDFLHNHPALDVLDTLSQLTPFEVERIGGILTNDAGITSGTTPRGINYVEEGVPFLGATNVKNGQLDLSSLTLIPIAYHDNGLASSQLQRGDVLVSMAGAVGRCCVYNTDEEANINQAIARLRVDINRVLPAFLNQYLNSKWGQLGFLKYRHDVGQPNINLAEIKNLPIILPSPEEQQGMLEKIIPIEREARYFESEAAKVRQAAADVLPVELELSYSATDDIRYFFKSGEEKNSLAFFVDAERINDRLHYLFSHPRFRVLDELQSRYSCTTMGDPSVLAAPIGRGEQPEYDDYGEVIVLKTVDLKNGFIDTQNALRVSRDFFESKAKAHIQQADVLIASTGYGSLGKVDVYEGDDEAMVDGHISILRVGSNYDPYFIAYFLRSYLGQLQIEKWFSGSSGQIEIQPADISKIIIPTSDANGISRVEQKRIADLITAHLNEARISEEEAAQKWDEAKRLFEQMLEGKTA